MRRDFFISYTAVDEGWATWISEAALGPDHPDVHTIRECLESLPPGG